MTLFYVEPHPAADVSILITKLTDPALGSDDIRISTVAGKERPIDFFILSTDNDDAADKLRAALSKRQDDYNPSIKDFTENQDEFGFEILPEHLVGLHPRPAGSVHRDQEIGQPYVA